MVKIHTWTRHHQAGWTEILFTSLDTHHIITSSYWHSRSYTQPHSCMLVNAVPHTDPYTLRTSLHVTSMGTSAVVRVILLHIVGWKEPHLETQEQCRSDKKTANKKNFFFYIFSVLSPGRTPLLSTSHCDPSWKGSWWCLLPAARARSGPWPRSHTWPLRRQSSSCCPLWDRAHIAAWNSLKE